MVYISRFSRMILASSLFLGIVFLLSGADKEYKEHGWAKLDTVRNKTPHSMLFYSQARGLASMLPDGTVIRIKALKTGFGNYYRVIKDEKTGGWSLRADTRDPKDPASQFLVSHPGIGDSIMLLSETAGGLFLASDKKTFDVVLASDKDVVNTLWTLAEDPKAGDTLESCFLKNNATTGMLTASYDGGGGSGEIDELKGKISSLLKDTPYLKVVYSRSGGSFKSRDITSKLNEKITEDGVLKLTGWWVEQLSGVSSWAAGTGSPKISGRTATIRFIVCGDKANEIEYKVKEKDKKLVISPTEGKFAKILSEAYAKHPATALKMKLTKLLSREAAAGSLNLKSSLVARTGYDGDPFEASQSSKVAIETVVELGDDDDQGAPKETIAGGSSRDLFLWAHKRPEFKGFGEQKIEGFGSEMVVAMQPLYSQGFAWLEESLPTPGQGTILFRALADSGDIAVCFSDSVAPHTVYRIVFGAAGNTKTIIYKNNTAVQEISNEQNENAHITPGMIEKCWVSLNNGFIIVGKGDPGSIILMAWQDPNPPKGIERVGFSTFKSAVKYTDVQKIADPIVIIAPQISYVSETKSVQVGSKESPVWSDLPLSPADVGTIAFQATGSEDASLILANDQNEGYIISFGADGNTCTKILDLKEGGELYGVYSTITAMQPSAVTEPLATSVEPVSIAKLDVASTAETSAKTLPSDTAVVEKSVDKPVALTADATAVEKSGEVVKVIDTPSSQTKQVAAKLVPTIKTASVSSIAVLDKGKPTKFWVSYYKGRFILGKGDIGKNPFCIYVDGDAPKGISKIGFAGKCTIQNLELWPEVNLDFDNEDTEYASQKEFSAFKGVLNIISPYNYVISQKGPTVIFKDRLTGMQWNMAGTPDPGAEYHFTVDVESNGIPNVKLLFQDPSAESIILQAMVTQFEAQKDASMRISQNLAYGTGPDMVSSMVALLSSSVAGAAGAGWAVGEAAGRSKLNELQQMANRYIYTENVDQKLKGQAEIKTEAQRNRQTLETKLEGILQLQLQDSSQLDYATKQWDDVLRLVTDFYVVEDKSVKTKLCDGLKEVYDAVKSLDLTTVSLPIYNRMINCLIKAYSNAYLTKSGDAADDARRRDWYLWINTLSRTLMNSPSLMAIGVDVNFKGEYLWFPVALPVPGKGSVTFEAKAYNNIFVGLSENPFQVRNRSTRMYEIVIGKWDNKTTAIHRKSLGDAVVEFAHKDKPELSPDPTEFKKYWINIDDGKISGGVGELGQNKLWEWADPYPSAPVKWVGFSNWLSNVTYRNIKVGYPYSTTSSWTSVDKAVVAEPAVVESVTDLQSEAVVTPEVAAVEEKPAAEKKVAKKKVVAKKKPVAKKTDASKKKVTKKKIKAK